MQALVYMLLTSSLLLMAQNSLQSDARDHAAGSSVRLIVLGNVQDAGSPHIGCRKECCKDLFLKPDPARKVAALGLVDYKNNKKYLKYLFDATPDIAAQLKLLKRYLPAAENEAPDGIFLTHAHIGHYAGLMFLGKEAMDAKEVPVFAMSRMDSFLRNNGPWSQLVARRNIVLNNAFDNRKIELSNQITITPSGAAS